MRHPPWESYVSHLCVERWALDPYELIKLMADIEALVTTGDVSHTSIATVLRMAGVPSEEAAATAPSICSAILPPEPPQVYPSL